MHGVLHLVRQGCARGYCEEGSATLLETCGRVEMARSETGHNGRGGHNVGGYSEVGRVEKPGFFGEAGLWGGQLLGRAAKGNRAFTVRMV